MADSCTLIFNENKEYLNWPGLKKLVDNKSILPEDKWNENEEYLNWPGLQYLRYTKINPAIYKNTRELKSRIDDENWYISCSYDDSSTGYIDSNGEVYIELNEDNQNFYFDQDGSCGCIQDYNGMLQVVVDRDLSRMVNGFIDDSIGPIGDNSDIIGDATGKLYVNFNINYEYDSSQ